MKKMYTIIILALIVMDGKGQTINGEYLDINNVKALINADGLNFVPSTANPISFEVPKGSGKQTIYSSALWIGGFDPGGQLKLAANTFRQTGTDYYPGPVNLSGVYTSS